MRRKLSYAAAMLCILAAALLLRLPRLGDRPFHGDEAVHAAKLRELWEHGRYEYDPNEYHGPTIYYAALPVLAARGRESFAATQEADYRLALALLGAAMVPLFLLLRDGLGTGGALAAALLTAVSAPFVFYSRYFIQEVALICFTLALIGCWWRHRVSGGLPWLAGAAVAAGLVIATKETSVLTFAALGLAWLAARPELPAAKVEKWRLGLAVVASLAVAYLFLSGFLSHPAGPLGYFETYTPWLRRAGGTELHRHPWHYYLSLLAWQRPHDGPVWTELLVLALAAVGAVTALSRKLRERSGAHPGFVRFALVYTVALTLAYSLIPYKTPWNLLSFYLGFLLLAGLGAGTLLSLPRSAPLKAAVALLLLAGAGHLAWQSQRATFGYRDDHAGPYVYAQPLRGVREIEQRVNELAAFSSAGRQTVAQVVFSDEYYWPLPWYLRRLERVGYWTGLPAEDEARLRSTPIVLSSSDLDEPLTERLGESHFMTGFHSLRPGVTVQLWVENQLWEGFITSRTGSGSP
ncbi:MAG: flippase activity-associated protein Agl23 [Armatimonadota bacterium]